MAIDQAADTDLAVQADPLELLQYRFQRTQKMLLVFAGISVFSLLLGLGLLALSIVNSKQITEINALVTQITIQRDEELSLTNAQLAASRELAAHHQGLISALDTQLARVDIRDSENALVKIQRILIRQERDYRDFLSDLQRGMEDIHMMVPHSSGWWSSYSEELRETISLSEARENYILTLQEN